MERAIFPSCCLENKIILIFGANWNTHSGRSLARGGLFCSCFGASDDFERQVHNWAQTCQMKKPCWCDVCIQKSHWMTVVRLWTNCILSALSTFSQVQFSEHPFCNFLRGRRVGVLTSVICWKIIHLLPFQHVTEDISSQKNLSEKLTKTVNRSVVQWIMEQKQWTDDSQVL